MTNKWWENPQHIHCLISTAKHLDAKYKDRKIIALGHTPSWLVVTIAMLRAARGAPRNVAYIPFSGKHHKLNYASLEDSCDLSPANDITIKFDFNNPSYAPQLNEAKRQAYFNYLSRHGFDKTQMLEMSRLPQDKKPVLIDYGYMASGIASFLESLGKHAQAQGLDYNSTFFDVHLYKAIYLNAKIHLDIELSDGSQRILRQPVETETSARSLFVQYLAGGMGQFDAHSQYDAHNIETDSDRARFMPYCSLSTENKESSCPLLKTNTPAANIISAKKALREALTLPEAKHQKIAKAGFQHLEENSPFLKKTSWIAFTPRYGRRA